MTSPGGVLFWAKLIEKLDWFVLEKDESSLELVIPVPVMAMERLPFRLDAGKQSAFTINRKEAPI